MFVITGLSCIGCLALYQVSYHALFPLLYNLTSQKNKSSNNDKSSSEDDSFQRRVNAQKFVSFVHAVISTYGAISSVLPYHMGIKTYATVLIHEEPYVESAVHLRFVFLEFTLGYFMADLFLYLQDVTRHSFMDIAHHVISIAAYLVGLMTENATGSFTMIAFQTNEISTPFYHLRFFMGLDQKLKQSTIYKLNEAVFATLFFSARIVYNGLVLLATLYASSHESDRHDLLKVRILLVSMFLYYIVQVVWFVKIAQIVAYKLLPKKTTSNKGVKQN